MFIDIFLICACARRRALYPKAFVRAESTCCPAVNYLIEYGMKFSRTCQNREFYQKRSISVILCILHTLAVNIKKSLEMTFKTENQTTDFQSIHSNARKCVQIVLYKWAYPRLHFLLWWEWIALTGDRSDKGERSYRLSNISDPFVKFWRHLRQQLRFLCKRHSI